MHNATGARYHCLLIGVDDYPGQGGRFRLGGCVNDIDAIEALLLDRVGVPPEQIRRLAAPLIGATPRTRLPSRSATCAEIRGALQQIAQDARGGDRVFVYYAGHGLRRCFQHGAERRYHEALVPSDFDEDGVGRLLYDFELSALLRDIAHQTDDVTVVLDCCHSAGATRKAGAGCRVIELENLPSVPAPAAWAPQQGRGLAALQPTGMARIAVVAACQADEVAREIYAPRPGQPRHGAFTACLLQALDDPQWGDLATLRWGELLPRVLGLLARTSPQTPWLIGPAERRVFGGPFAPRDCGYAVRAVATLRYQIDAGTWMGVSAGAELAVYGDTPDLFPALGSPEDRQARLGTLTVVQAGPTECIAEAPAALALPMTGARGRLARPGMSAALPVTLEPHDETLAAQLERDGWVQVLRPGTDPSTAEVRLVRAATSWLLLDDASGDEPAGSLAAVPAARPDAVAALLAHYQCYCAPLRLARAARSISDQAGWLQLSLLDCGAQTFVPGARGGDLDLPEVGRLPGGDRYDLREGRGFCLRARNTTAASLYATLFCCTASGRVAHLGDNEIGPGASQVFWMDGAVGVPFECWRGSRRPAEIDRLVVIATKRPGVSLRYLELRPSFAEGSRAVAHPLRAAPEELWTGAIVTLRIRAP